MAISTIEAPPQPQPQQQPPQRPVFEPPQRRSERVKLRRGLVFIGMTLLLPGSAQLAAGNRRVGRIALRTWAVLWAVLAFCALLALVWRGGAIALLTFGPTLRLAQAALVAIGIGWALLIVDAWRISQPPELAQRHRLGFAALALLLVAAIIGGTISAASMVGAQRDLVKSVFAGGGDTQVKKGRYNILLLGGDAGKTRTGLRPDSMTVASVDAETGRTVLVSLPRNLERVQFPESSPMHKKFPRGYYCSDHSCMLNAIYTYATEHKNLYPGVKNPGAQATKEAVEGVTGLKINYWVLIDLKGFEDLVDAVGGITMDVYRRVPIGGGTHPIYGYVEAGKNRHLNGHDALWFARSRSDSSDYDRIVRQKCVMTAMLRQLDPVTVLANFNKIAAAGKEVVASDIPTKDVSTMTELAMKSKKLPVSSVAIVPPLIKPWNPDLPKARAAVQAKIAASEAKDDPKPPATAAPKPSASAAKKKSTASGGGAAKPRTAQTDDLSKVCSA